MTVPVEEEVQDPSAGARARRPVPRRLLLVGLLAAGGLAAGVWWLLTPAVFGPPGSLSGLGVELGQPAVVGTGLFPSHEVVIVGVEPATPPPPGVTVTFHGCSNLPLGAARGELETACGKVRDIEGLPLEADGKGPWHVVARIEFSEPGTFKTNGFVVSFRDGLRRGRQTSGVGVEISAPEP
jgi:hypothetical protein